MSVWARQPLGYLILLGLVGMLLTGCTAPPVGLSTPNGVAAAGDGRIFVMDKGNHRIAEISSDDRLRNSFGSFGKGEGQIYFGWDLSIDAQGRLYFGNIVRDDEKVIHDGILVFDSSGQFLAEFGGADYPIGNDEASNKPYGLDVDLAGRIYTADYGVNQVRVFDSQGKLLGVLFDASAPFDFLGLNDVAVDDARQLLYAVDNDAQRVEQFSLSYAGNTPQVEYLRTLGSYGQAPGQLAFPQNAAVDENSGYLYVGDMANRRISVFDAQGQFRFHFSPLGIDDWQVMGLNFGPDGNLYAADAFNGIVWVFTPDGQVLHRLEARQR